MKLWFPRTVADYLRMYRECGYSCMTPNNTNANGKSLKMYKEGGLWPTCLYTDFPQVQGVCLTDDAGNLLARTFLVDGKAFLPVYPGGYTIVQQYGSLVDFIHLFKKEGIELTGDLWRISNAKNTDFLVPPVMFEGKHYCPLPHMDFLRKPFYVNYDENTDLYHFNSSEGVEVKATYYYNLWLELPNKRASANTPAAAFAHLFEDEPNVGDFISD